MCIYKYIHLYSCIYINIYIGVYVVVNVNTIHITPYINKHVYV